ncbi:MAG: hypothetical protein B7X07_02220 [Actinobacteria bacterium 21-64-8]|nr:MAG: hypothetical protein B7X07_02220 [Actinobacteria bacterium 21-64-8]
MLAVAIVVTLIVLLFARDVSRAAHNASGPRRSENLSFAAAANALVTRENLFDQRLDALLVGGASLSRPVFAARLDQLNGVLQGWVTTANQLRRPLLVHAVNDTLAELTLRRVAAYQTLLASVASKLSLPNPGSTRFERDPSPATTLTSTSAAWNVARFSLVREPGRAHLDALSNVTASSATAMSLSALRGSASLALVRSVAISALRVSPSALPSTPGSMLLPPVTSLRLGVSVTNRAYALQAVTLIVRLVPHAGPRAAVQRVLHATLTPLGSYAFVPAPIATVASEHATLTLRLVGAPGGAALTHTETYQVVVSPSGNG